MAAPFKGLAARRVTFRLDGRLQEDLNRFVIEQGLPLAQAIRVLIRRGLGEPIDQIALKEGIAAATAAYAEKIQRKLHEVVTDG